MTSKDYIKSVKQKNPKLFEKNNSLVQIRTDSLLLLIESAFLSGERAGLSDSKSIFDTLFPGIKKP